MLPPTLEPIIGEDGLRAWDTLVASLPSGQLYHGTSLLRAQAIMQEGFRTSFGRIVEDNRIDTYWGHSQVAANFAYRNAALENCPPAILSASLTDVLASGEPMALRTSCDDCDIEYPSWLECYEDTGSFWIRGGRHVAGLILHTI